MSVEFSIYLVREKILSAEQFVDLMAAQSPDRIPLGSLAIRANILTVRQVVAILNEQERLPRRFGDVARDLNFMTRAKVDRLVQMQREQCPNICRTLVALGYLSPDQVRALFQQFQVLKTERPISPIPSPKFSTSRTELSAPIQI